MNKTLAAAGAVRAWCELAFLPDTTWTQMLAPPGARLKFEKAPAGDMCSCMMDVEFLASANPSSPGQGLCAMSCSTTSEGAANSSCSATWADLLNNQSADQGMARSWSIALTDKESKALVSLDPCLHNASALECR